MPARLSPHAFAFATIALPCAAPVAIAPTRALGQPVLSPACLAPATYPGACGFYAECLEAGRPCESTPHPYALSYGAKYCSRFSTLSASGALTAEGRDWVARTRACLQEVLVDELPGGTRHGGTCRDLRAAAFDSHPFCYLSSGKGFCSLPLPDYPRILALYELPDMATGESIRQMAQVVDGCIRRWSGREGMARADGAASPAGGGERGAAERVRVLGDWRGRLERAQRASER